MSALRPRLAAPLLALILAAPALAFDLQAHRGGRGLAPENTLAAFSQAVALGVDTLELDIGLTADGVVVISHDTSLNPDHTRDAQGQWLAAKGPAIRSLTLAQLQRFDVGRIRAESDYGRQFARQQAADGQRIPTLAALFEQARASKVRFNIETKVDPTLPDETASPDAVADALIAEIERAGMASRVTIQSFDWRTLSRVAQKAPHIPRAYLSSSRTLSDPRWTLGMELASQGSAPQLVKAAAGASAAPVTWSPAFRELTQAQVQQAHQLRLQVLPWTVNARADMARLIDWGVDGIITDYPDMLRDVMRERGMALPPGMEAAK